MSKNKIVTAALTVALDMALATLSSTNSQASSNFPPPGYSGQNPPPNISQSPPMEKCYGVAGFNQNDCAYASFDGEDRDGPGTCKSCESAAWRWVPAGTCTRIIVGTSKEGKIIAGTMNPILERGTPEVCSPYNPFPSSPDDYGI